MNSFIDFHTHHPSREGEVVILNGTDTWGAHPWNPVFPPIEHLSKALAIGECGLDRLCDTPYETQLEAFRRQIRLSEQYGKPLILHCVKALDDVLRLQLEERAIQPWIFHAFRGKPQQIRQLLKRGMYVSFGFRHNTESIQSCPIERMLVESDEDPRPIRLLYEKIASLRQMDIEELAREMACRYKELFHPR
ncbi:MAG: TatD family hydrolase [Bacteroidaceae bacterium]|nr:TatD family hydrolase [Bacteroidaceae bacterium]